MRQNSALVWLSLVFLIGGLFVILHSPGSPTGLTFVEGNESTITASGTGVLAVSINASALDPAVNYSGSLPVVITDTGSPLVVFYFDFENNTLNLSNVTIDKVAGGLAVSGIEANKTFYFESGGYTSVCVNDSASATLAGISSDCTLIGEVLVPCDGSTVGGYSCAINGTGLIVSGLLHSAVMGINTSSGVNVSMNLTSISPSTMHQGAIREMSLSGDDFNSSATVNISNPDISVLSTVLINSTLLRSNISVSINTSLGSYDVTVEQLNQSSTLVGALTILEGPFDNTTLINITPAGLFIPSGSTLNLTFNITTALGVDKSRVNITGGYFNLTHLTSFNTTILNLTNATDPEGTFTLKFAEHTFSESGKHAGVITLDLLVDGTQVTRSYGQYFATASLPGECGNIVGALCCPNGPTGIPACVPGFTCGWDFKCEANAPIGSVSVPPVCTAPGTVNYCLIQSPGGNVPGCPSAPAYLGPSGVPCIGFAPNACEGGVPPVACYPATYAGAIYADSVTGEKKKNPPSPSPSPGGSGGGGGGGSTSNIFTVFSKIIVHQPSGDYLLTDFSRGVNLVVNSGYTSFDIDGYIDFLVTSPQRQSPVSVVITWNSLKYYFGTDPQGRFFGTIPITDALKKQIGSLAMNSEIPLSTMPQYEGFVGKGTTYGKTTQPNPTVLFNAEVTIPTNNGVPLTKVSGPAGFPTFAQPAPVPQPQPAPTEAQPVPWDTTETTQVPLQCSVVCMADGTLKMIGAPGCEKVSPPYPKIRCDVTLSGPNAGAYESLKSECCPKIAKPCTAECDPKTKMIHYSGDKCPPDSKIDCKVTYTGFGPIGADVFTAMQKKCCVLQPICKPDWKCGPAGGLVRYYTPAGCKPDEKYGCAKAGDAVKAGAGKDLAAICCPGLACDEGSRIGDCAFVSSCCDPFTGVCPDADIPKRWIDKFGVGDLPPCPYDDKCVSYTACTCADMLKKYGACGSKELALNVLASKDAFMTNKVCCPDPCGAGEEKPCYDGPAGTDKVPPCAPGKKKCIVVKARSGPTQTRVPTTWGCTSKEASGSNAGKTCYSYYTGTNWAYVCDSTCLVYGCEPVGSSVPKEGDPIHAGPPYGGALIVTDNCVPETTTTKWSDCIGQVLPETEVCDGIDNNCNKLIDEGFDTDGDGVPNCMDCNPSNPAVHGSAPISEFFGATSGGIFAPKSSSPAPELCDGLDNNCNGAIDEGCPCTTGSRVCGPPAVGTCSPGTQLCTNGVWSTCDGVVLPKTEICGNNLDDNCNGVVDDGCPGGPQPPGVLPPGIFPTPPPVPPAPFVPPPVGFPPPAPVPPSIPTTVTPPTTPPTTYTTVTAVAAPAVSAPGFAASPLTDQCIYVQDSAAASGIQVRITTTSSVSAGGNLLTGNVIGTDVSNDELIMVAPNTRGQVYTIPLAQLPGLYGNNGLNFVFVEASASDAPNIALHDYFLVNSKNDVAGVSNVLQYDSVDAANFRVTFKDLAGAIKEAAYDSKTMEGRLVVGAGAYKFVVGAESALAMDQTNDGEINGEEARFVFPGGSRMDFGPGFVLTLTTPSKLFDAPIGDENTNIVLDFDGFAGLTVPSPQATVPGYTFRLESRYPNISLGLTKWGILFTWANYSRSDDLNLTVPGVYSGVKAFGNIFVRTAVDFPNYLIPKGYSLIDTVKAAGCNGKRISLTRSISNVWNDVHVIACENNVCQTVTQAETSDDMTCAGKTITQLLTPALTNRKDSLELQDMTSVVSAGHEITDDGRAVTTGKYSAQFTGALPGIVGLRRPDGSVLLPANSCIGPSGTPILVNIQRPSSPMPVTLTMPVVFLPNADPNSYKIYVWDKNVWDELGGVYDPVNNIILVSIPDISIYLDDKNDALFLVAGLTCHALTESCITMASNNNAEVNLLVHGFTSSIDTWWPLVTEAKLNGEKYDWVGYQYPPSDTIEKAAMGLRDCLNTLGKYKRINIISHSVGGKVTLKALDMAYKEKEKYTTINNVDKVISLGLPYKGLDVKAVSLLAQYLAGHRTLARAFNRDSAILDDITAPDQELIKPVPPWARFIAVGGTEDCDYTQWLFTETLKKQTVVGAAISLPEALKQFILDNDCLVTVENAISYIENPKACSNVYTPFIWHPKLNDRADAIKLIMYLLNSEKAKANPERGFDGANQYVSWDDSCQEGKTYAIVGKKASMQYPLFCNCGNNVCEPRLGEDVTTCPSDCGAQRAFFCNLFDNLSNFLLLLFAVAYIAYLVRKYVVSRKPPMKAWRIVLWVLLLAIVILLLLILFYCRRIPLISLLLAALFALLLFFEMFVKRETRESLEDYEKFLEDAKKQLKK